VIIIMANGGRGISPVSVVNYLVAALIVIGVLLLVNGRWGFGILISLVAIIVYVNEGVKTFVTDLVAKLLSS